MNRTAATTFATALACLTLVACTGPGQTTAGGAQSTPTPTPAALAGPTSQPMQVPSAPIAGSWGLAKSNNKDAIHVTISNATVKWNDAGHLALDWQMDGYYNWTTRDVKDTVGAVGSWSNALGHDATMIGPLYAPDSPVCTSGLLKTGTVNVSGSNPSDQHQPYCYPSPGKDSFGYFPWGWGMFGEQGRTLINPGEATTQTNTWESRETLTGAQAGQLLKPLTEPAMWASFDAPYNGSGYSPTKVSSELACPGAAFTYIHAASATPACQ